MILSDCDTFTLAVNLSLYLENEAVRHHVLTPIPIKLFNFPMLYDLK